jgi:hypothetical protein
MQHQWERLFFEERSVVLYCVQELAQRFFVLAVSVNRFGNGRIPSECAKIRSAERVARPSYPLLDLVESGACSSSLLPGFFYRRHVGRRHVGGMGYHGSGLEPRCDDDKARRADAVTEGPLRGY